MRKRGTWKRFLTLLLSMLMVITMPGVSVWGENLDSDTPVNMGLPESEVGNETECQSEKLFLEKDEAMIVEEDDSFSNESISGASNLYICGVDIGIAPGTYMQFSNSDGSSSNSGYYYKGYYLHSSQCYGFATWCQYKIFGYDQWNAPGRYYNVTANGVSSVSAGALTESTLKAMIKASKPGACIRTRGSTQHSMVITEITDSGFSIAQCNGSNNNEYSSWKQNYVGTYTYTWQSYLNSTYGSRGIEFIKMPYDYPENEFVDLGENFYAYIINTAAWTHVTPNLNGTNVYVSKGDADNKVFHFERQGDGSYKITAKDGRCIEVHNYESANGTAVELNWYNGNTAQRWYIYGESGAYELVAVCGDNRMDMANGNSTDGAKIQMWAKNDSYSQKFQVWKVSAAVPGYVGCAAGTKYTPTSIWWDAGENAMEYDLKIWKNKLWDGDAYTTVWGIKGIEYQINLPEGYYEGYVDYRNGYSTEKSVNNISFTVSGEQVVDLGDQVYVSIIINDPWISIVNKDGNVRLSEGENDNAWFWKLEKQGDGSYVIRSTKDDKVLAVANGADANKANVCVENYTGANSQKWFFYGRWSGEYYIRPKCSSRVLDITNGNNKPGDNVALYDLNYSNSQRFAIWVWDPPSAATLTCKAGTNLSQTTFNWNETDNTNAYTLKIWKGVHWTGELVKTIEIKSSQTTTASVILPEGDYEAYIDSSNDYSYQMSNVVKFTVKFEQESITKATVTGISNKTYNGSAQTQSPTVKIGDKTLTNGTDYSLSYKNNTNAGTATVTITGKNKYKDSVNKNFTISPASISNATVSGLANKTYNGSAQTQNLTVKVGDKTLTNGTDYTISYANNTNAGTATVTITGKGNYSGTLSKTFTISSASISNATVSGIANKTYTGSAQTQNPTVKIGDKTLVNGTDYTLSYANNTNVGTATVTITGKGNYTGSISKTFTIGGTSIAGATVSGIANKTYNGSAQTQSLTVKLGDKTLTINTDYTVSYANNTNAGTATVTITGKGNYADSISKTFTISPASISNATVSGISNKTYTGSAQTQNPTVKIGDKTLVNGTDYSLSYANNTNVGTATVTITGKGNYSGSISKTFTIASNTYTITYNMNGVSGSIASQTKIYGQDLTLSTTVPTRSPRYKFVGWNTDKNATTAQYSPGGKYTANSDATLYAIWALSHNPFGDVNAVQSTVGGKILVRGWALDDDEPGTSLQIHVYVGGPAGGTGTMVGKTTADKKRTDVDQAYSGFGANHGFEETFSTAKTGNQEVYIYAINVGAGNTNTCLGHKTVNVLAAYTVSYNMNGGSGSIANQTKTQGQALTLSSTKPTKAGFTFSNWNTKADGSGASYGSGSSYTADASVTLYAIWKADPTPVPTASVTFKVGSVSGRPGKDVVVPVSITKNPGIAGFSLDVSYDNKILTLKSIEADAQLGGTFSTNGNVVNWYVLDNVKTTGTVFNVTFTIAKDTTADTANVNLAMHDGKPNVTNENSENISASFERGTVTILKTVPGDVNGDGDVTIADVVKINRHVLGRIQFTTAELLAADVNGDGDVTIADVVKVNRFVLGKITTLAGSANGDVLAGKFDGESLAEAVGFAEESDAEEAMTVAGDVVPAQVTVGTVEAKVGETVEIPVTISGNPGIAGLAFELSIPENVTLQSIEAGELLSKGTFSVNENVVSWFGEDNLVADGTLMVLKVSADKSGEYTIGVGLKGGKPSNLSDENGDSVKVTFEPGTLTVKAESLPTPTDVPLPTPTAEPLPTPTAEPLPTPTDVPLPTPTAEPLPTPTDEPLPTPTDVPLPIPTDEPLPTPTDVPLPTPTDAPLPTPTDVPLPTPTEAPLPTPTEVPIVSADSISLNKTTLSMKPGDRFTLVATVLPENATDKTVTWKSGATGVVKVSKNGILTAVGAGTATIRAMTSNGVKAYCKVTVAADKVTKVTLNKTSASTKVGLTVQLTANTAPAGASGSEITWKSANTKIAKVNSKGLVTAVRSGTTKITATAASGASATCTVKVAQLYVYECQKDGVYRYTTSTSTIKELNKQGWSYKTAFRAAGKSNNPVYSIYYKTTKRYRYTTVKSIATAAKKAGNKVSLAFYGSATTSIPVYELCKEGKRPTYYYTTNKTLVKTMKKKGWTYKGIGWYAELKTLE